MGWDDHYPYGMIMAGRSGNSGQGDTKYRFISKERDTETGYDWLDVRAYDSRIARFFAPDPLMDQSPLSSWSPYHYSFDNPVLFLDPQGTWPEVKWSSAIASTFGIIGYGTQTVLASFAIPFTGGWSMPIAVHGSTGYVQSIRNLADNLQGKESTHGEKVNKS